MIEFVQFEVSESLRSPKDTAEMHCISTLVALQSRHRNAHKLMAGTMAKTHLSKWLLKTRCTTATPPVTLC